MIEILSEKSDADDMESEKEEEKMEVEDGLPEWRKISHQGLPSIKIDMKHPKSLIDGSLSEIKILDLFLNEEFFNHICIETNKYAEDYIKGSVGQ